MIKKNANNPRFLLFFFFIFLNLTGMAMVRVYAEADQRFHRLIEYTEWHIPDILFGYIVFGTNSYRIGAYEGAGDFAKGNFIINDAKSILLEKPTFSKSDTEFLKSAIEWTDGLWKEQELLLTYNSSYANLLYTGSLDSETGKVVFVSTNKTPEGAEFDYHGFKAIKEKSRFIVEENLIMRKEPTINSESNYYALQYILSSYGWPSFELNNNSYEIVDMEARVLPKGYEITTLARTATTDLIDGREAHWHLYSFDVFNAINKIGWIFGGYLSPYEHEKSIEYRNILEERLLEMNWIKEE